MSDSNTPISAEELTEWAEQFRAAGWDPTNLEACLTGAGPCDHIILNPLPGATLDPYLMHRLLTQVGILRGWEEPRTPDHE